MSTPDETPRADAGPTDATGTDHEDAGTSGGDPIAGVRIDEAEAEHAVEPDSDAFEAEGPGASAGHA